jgi:hypothetical protein
MSSSEVAASDAGDAMAGECSSYDCRKMKLFAMERRKSKLRIGHQDESTAHRERIFRRDRKVRQGDVEIGGDLLMMI